MYICIICTDIDVYLFRNSIPTTTTAANLKTKISIARGKIYTDVGFWGGLVPGNIENLDDLAASGVIGFQGSLCPAPEPVTNEFCALSKHDIEKALEKLEDWTLIAVIFSSEVNVKKY